MLTKKLVGAALAAVVAVQLYGHVSHGSKKVIKQLRGLEKSYRAALKLTEPEP